MAKGLHIAINASDLGRRRGGNESYVRGLIAGLAAPDITAQVSLLLCAAGKRTLLDVSLPPRFTLADTGPYRRLPFYLWQQTAWLRKLQPDCYISSFFLPLILPCPGVVVIHDLSFLAHPTYFPPLIAFYMRLLTGLAVWQARRVIAVSQFTYREIMRFYHLPSEKVSVVLQSISDRFSHIAAPPQDLEIRRRYRLPSSYILAVGNIHPRKNLPRLLDAYILLLEPRPPLVLVGQARWGNSELWAKARAVGARFTGFVPDADLPAIYRGAACFVYPSLYEGFGLPPLEAMACGVPTIASNTTAVPEAVGDGALTVDPTDSTAIAEAIARLLTDESLRQGLITRALRWRQNFSWTKTAQRMIAECEIACAEETGF